MNKYTKAFQKAQQESYLPLSDQDHEIIRKVTDFGKRLASLEGWTIYTPSIREYTTQRGNKQIIFDFSVNFHDQDGNFSILADKGNDENSSVEFSFYDGQFGDKKLINLIKDINFEETVILIAQQLGGIAGAQRRRDELYQASRYSIGVDLPKLIN